MWDLWWTKWRWGRFSPSTSISPAKLHSNIFNDLKFKIPMTSIENFRNLTSKSSSPEFKIIRGPSSNAPSCYDIPERVVAKNDVFNLCCFASN
jgi:hypothetical protein